MQDDRVQNCVQAIALPQTMAGQRIAIECIYIPLERTSRFKFDDASHAIAAFAEEHLDIELGSSRQTIRAAMPASEERGQLHIACSLPVLEMERVEFTSDGRPFTRILTHYRAERYECHTFEELQQRDVHAFTYSLPKRSSI